MDMKNLFLGLSLTLGAFSLMAEIPAGYYSTLEGKSGAALKQAVKAVCRPADFVTPEYDKEGGTWTAFESTDVRIIDGKRIWWDMYSNVLVKVEDGHKGFNIEHSVANSWWGKVKNDAYQDLFHLNPSEQLANGAKSNNPLGCVAVASFDNGLIKVGTAKNNTGAGAPKVFEPADEYKGDFARAYLYVFTAYSDMESWVIDGADVKDSQRKDWMYAKDGDGVTLKPDVVKMLLDWAAADPVDEKEYNRNEEIYKIQHNRNPYIDYPALVEYVWGAMSGVAFKQKGNEVNVKNRPRDPFVQDLWMTGVNTYYGRWWDSQLVKFDSPDGKLMITYGNTTQQYGEGIEIPSATKHDEIIKLSAKAVADLNGTEFNSSTAYVTLVAKDPAVVDYSEAVWSLVTDDSNIEEGVYYVITAADNRHVMGNDNNKFMGSRDYLKYMPNGDISTLPYDAGMIKFHSVATTRGNSYTVEVLDMIGNSKGYMSTSKAKELKLSANAGTSAIVNITDGNLVLDFGAPGKLFYNQSTPRFLNYTSTGMTPLLLYRFKEFPKEESSGVVDLPEGEDDTPIAVEGRNIYAGDGGAVYTLDGRRVTGLDLAPGIYVAVTRGGKSVKIAIR